jgi:hypothetical protein
MTRLRLKSILTRDFGDFFRLLLSLLIYLLSVPFLQPFGIGKIIATVFFLSIFFVSIYAIGHNRRWFIVAVIMSAIIVCLKVVAFTTMTGVFSEITASIVSAVCFITITIAILIRTLEDKEISINDIYGAICSYLLIGIAWAYLFLTVALLDPQAFHIPQIGMDATHKIPHLIYFSFITLTSTGFGDIYPVNMLAETLTYLEAIVGQIYLIAIIGWMVGIYASRSSYGGTKKS